jgi:hypothetical protein
MDYYDFDPVDPNRDAERARVAQGFKDLVKTMEVPILAAQAAADARRRVILETTSAPAMGDPRPLCARLHIAYCTGTCINRSCPAKGMQLQLD